VGSTGSSGGPSSVVSRSSSRSQVVNVSHFVLPLGSGTTDMGATGRRARECRMEGLPEQARAAHSAACSSQEAASDSCRADFEATADRHGRAEEHHAAGYAFRKQFEFLRAVEEYSSALALVPGHFKALFNRGYSYDKVRASPRINSYMLSCLQPFPSPMSHLSTRMVP